MAFHQRHKKPAGVILSREPQTLADVLAPTKDDVMGVAFSRTITRPTLYNDYEVPSPVVVEHLGLHVAPLVAEIERLSREDGHRLRELLTIATDLLHADVSGAIIRESLHRWERGKR